MVFLLQLLQLVHLLALKLVQIIQPVLGPLCLVLAWGLAILTLWNLGAALRDGLARAKTMHRIPCADCRYFTHNYLLKCPLHPKTALSEAAIDCGDFETE